MHVRAVIVEVSSIELMEASCAKTLKVAIELHEGTEKTTKKVWRFKADSIPQYSRDVVEAEVLELFPHIQAKDLRLKLFHFDEIAGRVHIDSDGYMQEALTNFSGEWHGPCSHEFLVLHAEDTCPVIIAEADPNQKSKKSSVPPKTRKIHLSAALNARCMYQLHLVLVIAVV